MQEEAKRVLSTPNQQLADRLAEALASQPAEQLVLFDPNQATTVPVAMRLPLAQSIEKSNPAAFGGRREPVKKHEKSPDRESVIKPIQNGNGLMNGNSSGSESSGITTPLKPKQQKITEHVSKTPKSNFKIPKVNRGGETPGKNVAVNLNKLSKEDEVLMQKSLSKLKSSRAEISLTNCSPRARRKPEKSSSRYKEKSDSESSEDEDGNPKPKSKFFKHTEKERNDEKLKKRDDKKKKKDDEDEYNPG